MVHRCAWQPALPWLLALAVACSRATDGAPGAPHVVPDGGVPPKDGGPSAMDGRAPRVDASAPRIDAGAPRIDSGAPRTDSGTRRDSGGPPSGADASSGAVTICAKANLLPLAKGTCSVTAGGTGTLITGTILTEAGVLRGGQVFFDSSGVIQCVDCDCSASAKGAAEVVCPTGVVSPGLINAHDHITYTQNSPYTDTGERYEHRNDWRDGLNGHTPISVTGGATPDQVHWGELRFLLGGATSTVGSGGAAGILRNLDKAAFLEGLNQTPVDFNTFPLGDANGTQLAQGCGYPNVVTDVQIAADDAFLPHVAEGIGAFAENEFSCLSEKNPGHDVVIDKSAFIHAVGLTAADYADMAKNGTALVWSPRSNLTLYGDTARVAVAARLGVSVALGTDWISTGSMNLLRELKCADSFNQKYLGSFFTDRDLWLMVTGGAASATATDDVIGALVPGKVADVTIFDGRQHRDYRAVLDANPEDVVFVARAGKLLYGDASIVTAVRGSGTCDDLQVCSVSKEVCLADEIGETLPLLQAAVGTIYPAFFCGTPQNEPTCVPERPKAQQGSTIYTGILSVDDLDGDGVPNSLDDCPRVFNPVRPMDSGVQPDADADGVGDACDPCPLAANTSSCQ